MSALLELIAIFYRLSEEDTLYNSIFNIDLEWDFSVPFDTIA